MHIPALHVAVPSNAQKYFEVMLPIVSFDLLDDLEFYNNFIIFVSRKQIDEKRKKTLKKVKRNLNEETERTYDEINISD